MSRFPGLRDRIALALAEDLGEAGDVTSQAVFGPGAQATASVVAKAPGVLCGNEPFRLVFEHLGGVSFAELRAEGSRVEPGDKVFELSGSVRSILAGERTALNLLQRLSGIATATARYAELAGKRLAICDTRKTTPLWRDLEKHAVAVGGGFNHRMGLFDMVMLKDTHADGAGGLAEALRRVEHLRPALKVAAEARNLLEVRAALDAKVDLLMLDNMTDPALREAVALVAGAVPIEVTGGITEERLDFLAHLGVDRISSGALTHSVRALDFSLRIAAG